MAIDTQTAEVKKEKQINLQTKIMLHAKECDLDKREDDIKTNEDNSRAALQGAVALRDTALQVLLRVQKLEEEDRELIELGKQQRHKQRVAAFDSDDVIKKYHELDERIKELIP